MTGGAVRLTDSGLGCPTWPRARTRSLTPTKQYAIHGIIEFTNRQLTFVLVVVAVATWLVAMALPPRARAGDRWPHSASRPRPCSAGSPC